MNERIKELAIQAYVAAGHDRNHELFNALLDESAEFHEKFAELVRAEALELAEEALIYHTQQTRPIQKTDEALAAIREVLAEPVKQEPVHCHERQWVDLPVACDCGDVYPADSFGAGFIAATGRCQNCDVAAPVSAKRKWVDLTDDELKAALEVHQVGLSVRIGRIAIAAFKEKNK